MINKTYILIDARFRIVEYEHIEMFQDSRF